MLDVKFLVKVFAVQFIMSVRAALLYHAVDEKDQHDLAIHCFFVLIFFCIFDSRKTESTVTSQLSMGWVDPWVGLGRVHYSQSAKNLKGLC